MSVAAMSKMKGIFKSFKCICQIFVVKEHEMEIGYPTDVRHVAHIGWNIDSTNAPTWMSSFKTSSDFSSTSLSNLQSRETSWASQDFEEARGSQQSSPSIFEDHQRPDIPKAPKKNKRRKEKPSSPSSSTRSSRRSSQSKTSFSTAIEEDDNSTVNQYCI